MLVEAKKNDKIASMIKIALTFPVIKNKDEQRHKDEYHHGDRPENGNHTHLDLGTQKSLFEFAEKFFVKGLKEVHAYELSKLQEASASKQEESSDKQN